MKALRGLLVCCALSAASSVYGQSARVCESFRYSLALVQAEVPKKPVLQREFRPSEIREIERPAPKSGSLARKISFVADPEDLPPILQDSFKAYFEGMRVRLPIVDEDVLMFVRSGLAWELGKDLRLVLPYTGRQGVGFKVDRRY